MKFSLFSFLLKHIFHKSCHLNQLFVFQQDGEQGKEGSDSKAEREEGNRGDDTAD